MTLVNCTVISSSNKIVYLWKISHVGADQVSITEFYVNNIDPKMDAEQKNTLCRAYLGKSKDCSDLIDVSNELNTAVNLFGPFQLTPINSLTTKGYALAVSAESNHENGLHA